MDEKVKSILAGVKGKPTPEEIDRWEKLRKEDEKRIAEQIKKLSPTVYTNLSLNDFETQSFDKLDTSRGNVAVVEKFLAAWQPNDKAGFMLVGEPGSGKTHMLKAMCIRLAYQSVPCEFHEVASVMDKIRQNFDQIEDVFNFFKRPHVLFLDDLGAERTTEFVQEKFLRLLNDRHQLGKVTCASSNLKLEQLRKRYDVRIIDRLKGQMIFVEVEAPSYRPQIIVKIQRELAERAKHRGKRI